jgi:formylglycine-generating enzyme required for sulfatase activity
MQRLQGFRVALSSVNLTTVVPTIAVPLQSVTVTVGQTAQFTVTATGTAPLTYLWQFNGMNIAGATQSTLVITNAQASSAGDYRVVVSNSGGSVISAVAKLTVNPSKPEGGPAGFVWIPPGTFMMGSPLNEPNRNLDEIQHSVRLTQGFWLSDHEVTQEEYQAVMGSNPSFYKGDLNRPVESVSWTEAVLYCQKRTEMERAAGKITAQQAYRLPTEAEWEYAARAGTTGARHGELDEIAWWSGNSGDRTHPVKQKAANGWGLYDMLGNVLELCSDWFGDYPTGSVTDPTGPGSGSRRVTRGGSCNNVAEIARSAFRDSIDPGFRIGSNLGFRPALSSVR